MERFVEFEIHEYMDMYPEKGVRTFIGETEEEIETTAKAWAENMNKNYSGGTTRIIKVMSSEEARAYLDAEIAKIKNPDDGDKEWIEKVNSLYTSCYIN